MRGADPGDANLPSHYRAQSFEMRPLFAPFATVSLSLGVLG